MEMVGPLLVEQTAMELHVVLKGMVLAVLEAVLGLVEVVVALDDSS